MKIHPRHCKPGEQPCSQEHAYMCSTCGDQFVTDEATYLNRLTELPSKFWPVCSLHCYRNAFSDQQESNPNGLTWAELDIKVSEGFDPDEPIDFQDRDDLDELARIDLAYILETTPEEELA